MISELRAILGRRWRLIALPLIFIFLVPSVIALTVTKTYISAGTIEVEPNAVLTPVVSLIEREREIEDPIRDTLALAEALVFSSSFLDDVARRSGMVEPSMDPSEARSEIRKALLVQPVGPQRLLVTAQMDNPFQAQAVATATVELIMTERRRRVADQATAANAFFEGQVEEFEKQLGRRERAVSEFRQLHPEVSLSQQKESILTELESLRAQLGQTRIRIREGRGDLAALTALEADLLADIEALAIPIGATPDVELKLLRLEAELSEARSGLEEAIVKANEAILLGQVLKHRVAQDKVVDVPEFPASPTRGKAVLLAILAFLVSLVMAGGLVVAAEYLDPTIRRPSDLADLGVPVLGVVRAA